MRAGIVVTIVGYCLAFASIQLEQPWAEQGHPREPYVIAAGLVALWLRRRGRTAAAATLILMALWIEVHLSLAILGPRAPVGGVLPAIVTGVVLFLGPRPGRHAALSTLASVPGAAFAGSLLRVGPGIRSGDLLFLVAIEASTLGTLVLLGLLMKTLGGVLQNAERDAQRVRELIDGAPDALVCVSGAGTIEDCNPRAEELLAPPDRSLVGMAFAELGLRRASAATRSEAGIDLSDLEEAPCELAVEAGPEGRVVLESAIQRVTRQHGGLDTLVVLRDVTARKRAEEHTSTLERKLQHAQKLEALGKLAGGVSHDFNNLLMAVGGYGDALSRHGDAKVREIARRLLGLKERAAGLTGQLLAFARKGMTQPERMDLSAVVRGMRELLSELVGPTIRVRVNAAPGAWIQADPAQLEQVLLNLALNARDAMPGGGSLDIRCERDTDEARVRLEVSDTGTGMDESTRLQAFEPFFTTKPRSRGTGLGLSLVHGIVQASGGTLDLDSRPGEGTRFRLYWSSDACPERGLEATLDAGHPLLDDARGEEHTPPPSSAVNRRQGTRPRPAPRVSLLAPTASSLDSPSEGERNEEERGL